MQSNPVQLSIPLHELCADSIRGDGAALEPPWEMALAANFGSAAAWREQFAALAHSHQRPGYVALLFRPSDGRLVNDWFARDAQVAPGTVPILALDTGDGDVPALMRNIDHEKAYARYQHAVHDASEAFACTRDGLGTTPLLDVRRAGAFEKATHMIEGAQWRDPAKVGEWSSELRAGDDVVVYCVYGHEVCRATALRLRAAGVNARFLEGGIDAWQKAGGPLRAK